MGETIFISSTCYDLIDLRAEIETELRALGLTPVMSDRASSEFHVLPDINSIESCLVNVRRCDSFIILLSQRYGPSLKGAGFEDISATHLEYIEARKTNKPIYMYVRDRLEADYSLWRTNKDKGVKLAWVKGGDENIFSLLEDHRKLAAKQKRSNWFWIFRDSVELKDRIRKDFKASAAKGLIQDLIDKGRMAFLLPEIDDWTINKQTRTLSFKVKISNAGTSIAIQPFISLYWDNGYDVKTCPTLLPGSQLEVSFEAKLSVAPFRRKNPTMDLECSYSTPEGHYIADEAYIEFYWRAREKDLEKPICEYRGKKYYHSKGLSISVEEDL